MKNKIAETLIAVHTHTHIITKKIKKEMGVLL